ncbi:Uncharacterised protein [Enterobacter cloacae]|uniref:Uncharacterized protein n=1 Tax=Enterobacter cloacae TaxID=550 RepID=A0A377M044_ENTCL|nr:Uncharacterised protein [Enterobacter cloacae]
MRNRQLLGKWLLIITCLAMAICLVQRAVYLNHFLQGLDPQVQTLMMADAPGQEAEQPGPSPCQLGAQSLLCAQPLFFDGALPRLLSSSLCCSCLPNGAHFSPGSSLSRHRLPEYTSKTAFP